MAGHLAAATIKKVIEVTDVDGVVRKIDVDSLVQRIDVNNVVERIDVDRVVQRINVDETVVDRIDIDKAVSRIDINALLDKVDWNTTVMDRIDFDAILKKVDTSSIVLRSSTGFLDAFLDTLRTHVILLDLYLWVLTRGNFWTKRTRSKCYLPPKPGVRQRDDHELYPKGRSSKAVAVQGRFVGFVTKTIIMMIDMFTVSVLFALLWRFFEWSLVLFLGHTNQEAQTQTQYYQETKVWWALAIYWVVYWFGYFFLCTWLTGQTLGMVVMGCRVVNCAPPSKSNNNNNKTPSRHHRRHHHHRYTLTMGQTFYRTIILPVTLTICPPLLIMGLYRRDGRMLHDWCADTGMIYSWDAKLAKMREKIQRDVHADEDENDDDIDDVDANVPPMVGGRPTTSVMTTSSDYDEFDEWMEEGEYNASTSNDDDDRQSAGTLYYSSRSEQGREVVFGQEPLLRGEEQSLGRNDDVGGGRARGSSQEKKKNDGTTLKSNNHYETFVGK